MCLATLLSAMSVVGFANAGSDVDIDELRVRVDRDASGWLFELYYEIDVEDARRFGPLEFVVSIEYGGQPIVNDGGEPVQFVLPLDTPSEYDGDDVEYVDRVVFAVTDVTRLPVDRLEASGAVFAGADDYPLAFERTRAQFVGDRDPVGHDGYVVYDAPVRSSHVSIAFGVGSYWAPQYRYGVATCRSGYVRHSRHYVSRSVGIRHGHGYVRPSPVVRRTPTLYRSPVVTRSATTRRPSGITRGGHLSQTTRGRSYSAPPRYRSPARTSSGRGHGVRSSGSPAIARHGSRTPSFRGSTSTGRTIVGQRGSSSRSPFANFSSRSSASRGARGSSRPSFSNPATRANRPTVSNSHSRGSRSTFNRAPGRTAVRSGLSRSSGGQRTPTKRHAEQGGRRRP